MEQSKNKMQSEIKQIEFNEIIKEIDEIKKILKETTKVFNSIQKKLEMLIEVLKVEYNQK